VLGATCLAAAACGRISFDPRSDRLAADGRLDGISVDAVAQLTAPVVIVDQPGVTCESLAFDGGAIGVVWNDDRGSMTNAYFRRFAPDGTPLGNELTLTTADVVSGCPAVVWADTQYGIFYTVTTTRQQIFYASVSATGARLAADTSVTPSNVDSNGATAAWSGGQLSLAYISGNGNSDLRHEHVSLTGIVTHDNVVVSSLIEATHAVVASDQGGVALTYLNFGAVQYTFIGTNGAASPGGTLDTAMPSTAGYGGASSVYVGGGTQLVAVGTGTPPSGVELVTVTATTGAPTANPVVLPGDRRAPLLAIDNTHVAIAGGYPPYVQLLARDGMPTDNVLPMPVTGMSVANNIVANPAGGFYTIWVESPDGISTRLMLARISP
jgi:hypothetical protein